MRPFVLVLLTLLLGCENAGSYDPLALARATNMDRVHNIEAGIPPQCYTKTGSASNPCWVCHTSSHGNNLADDWKLQRRYNFSAFAHTNHWTNLFKDRSKGIAAQSDAEILAWVRQDNYSGLRRAMQQVEDFPGWRPDLNYGLGFDDQGFARDGSGWRAFRYKPFPGAFWPTNGSTDDVLIRLPTAYRRDTEGHHSRAIYKINLALTVAAVAVPNTVASALLTRRVEPLDEQLAGMDLNGDGRIKGIVTVIRGLPAHYVGAARQVPVVRGQYPAGTEFLHTVHYLDPAAPGMKAPRMKEVRYARKAVVLTPVSIRWHYAEDAREQKIGGLPSYAGNALTGLANAFGWTFQGYIEDARGRLRLQTREEQLYCMGCHTGLGVTVDGTFAMPRKIPGAAGWGMQRLRGQQDVPQVGSDVPEYRLYLRRVGGGDAFRANSEMLARFFSAGELDIAAYRAAVQGSAGIMGLIAPTRERALALDKAYRLVVREQSYRLGRAPVLAPMRKVHHRIENTATALKASSNVYKNGRLWLQWPTVP